MERRELRSLLRRSVEERGIGSVSQDGGGVEDDDGV